MKKIFEKKIMWFVVAIIIILLLPLIWYSLPYQCREDYYRFRYGKELYEPILIIYDFDISEKGCSIEYDFYNNYVMPISIGWVFEDLPNALPNYSKSNKGMIFDLNLIISVEIIVDGKSLVKSVSRDDIDVSYSWVSNDASIYIGKVDYPLRARFSNNVKIKLEVLETDERLIGGTGRLIIRPFPYR